MSRGLFTFLFAVAVAVFAAMAEDAPVDYLTEVKPILARHCYKCHGPEDRKGGLGLATADAILKGGSSGDPAVVAHDAAGSPLTERVSTDNPDDRMPPKGAPLDEESIAILRAWIDQGATFGEDGAGNDLADHWAFQTPEQPETPEVDGAANAIDAFVRARLAAEGLIPSPEADRYSLVRRLYLDLIGLPPTPDQVRAFVNDTRPDTYERLVEELLASPHYGERRAMRWLDVARYADTNGYEKDRPRSIWPYRDWVIDAFNRDLPYDDFVVKQLAGDLLPNATEADYVATGFLRNSLYNEEGGVDVEEVRYAAMVDRTNTTAEAFLGLTFGCAQCHDHKYDPVSQAEYYRFFAFLNNTDNVEMPLHDADIATRRAAIADKIAAIEADLPNRFPVDDPEYTTETVTPRDVTSSQQSELAIQDDGAVLATGARRAREAYTLTVDLNAGDPLAGIALEALTDESLPNGGPGRAENGNFVLTEIAATIQPADGDPLPLTFARAEAPIAQPDYPVAHAIDGNEKTGWAIHDPSQPLNENREASFYLDTPATVDGPATLTVILQQHHGGRHTLGKFRVRPVRQGVPASDLPKIVRRKNHLDEKFAAWRTATAEKASPWTVIEPLDMTSKNGATLSALEDGSVLVSGTYPNVDTYTVTFRTETRNITGLRIEALPHESLPGGGPGRGVIMSDPGDFLLSEVDVTVAPWSDPEAATEVTFAKATADFAADGREIEKSIDGEVDTGWSINGQQGQPHHAVYALEQPVDTSGASLITLSMEHFFVHQHTLGRFRVSVTTAENPEASGVPADIEALLLAHADHPVLRKYYLSVAPELAAAHAEIAKLHDSMPEFPTTLVLRERPAPRVTHVHHRGEYLSPREAVAPGTPAVLHEFPAYAAQNRLSFARWIASEENPLLARVTVNRLWAEFFGRGLVETTEDFGIMGSLPSHPELLDWLSTEFMRRGWRVKDLVRLMVHAETYKQTAAVTEELIAADPKNVLLARAPRFRVDAELVRDIALAGSGLLNPEVGGPSVYPYLTPGILEGVYAGSESMWPKSTEGDQYRRGLYTFWKRALPYPSQTVFDQPQRDMVCTRRERSNTPLQALTLLNNDAFMVAAAGMAKRILDDQPNDPIAHAFLLTVGRPPDAEERGWVAAFLDAQKARFTGGEADPAALHAIESAGAEATPELAAWTAVCRVLLNLDETITKA